ncbi:MAG TPA: GNAT family N-acetyltransferase [Dongiaceae bacterium]|jgi:GNAT superfamily N-acetyltransferase|nr:GNAT family N-acetyltransferase [Dongiaceae bacterium]
MDFAIRPYVEADRRGIIGALIALQEHERAIHDTRLPGEDATEIYLGTLFVAEAGGRFAGLVAGLIEAFDVVLETSDSCIYGYCSDVYVAPEFRGTGLAHLLLNVLERDLARKAPISPFRVNVLAINRIACRAYERAGFVPYEVMYERLVQRDRSQPASAPEIPHRQNRR